MEAPSPNRNIVDLPNLGPRCAEWLAQIEIHDEAGLRAVGAAAAFRELVLREVAPHHRMLLFALGGAMAGKTIERLNRAEKRELEEETGLY